MENALQLFSCVAAFGLILSFWNQFKKLTLRQKIWLITIEILTIIPALMMVGHDLLHFLLQK